MTGLDTERYLNYARARVTDARRTVDEHAVCSYTGLCLACGRPGPCATSQDARRTLAGYAWLPGASPLEGRVVTATSGSAIGGAAGAVDELRAACLAAESAVDRAAAQPHGVDHPLPRATLDHWDAALTDAWQALGLVRAGIAEARQLPGAPPISVGDMLDGVLSARADARRATSMIMGTRIRLAAAEDRLRHAHADPVARAAADRWGAAIVRLDSAAARLAVGARCAERYADRLAGDPPPTRPRQQPPGDPAPAAETAAGLARTGELLLRRYPFRGRRGFAARVRQQVRRELVRSVRW